MANNNRELILNSVFLKNRIQELGIKQWWLAEQVGVDRKTVIRWIQGKVRFIQIENATALVKILSCSLSDLALKNEADQLATEEDQENAATLIANSALMEKLGPIGEWNVIEGLLKATIVPNLPLNILAELYNQLTVASWRQSKIDQAEIYNVKAIELATKSGDKTVLAGALLSKGNILSWRGKIKQSTDAYESVLKEDRFIDDKVTASLHSNLGAVLYESGYLDKGEQHIKKAIGIYEFHGTPMNLSIGWCHLSILSLKKGDVTAAIKCNEQAIRYSNESDYKRGLCMGNLISAEIAALQNLENEAKIYIQKSVEGFTELNIDEGLIYEFTGRVCRLLGDYNTSVEYFEKGILISKNFPLSLAELNFELALTYLKLNNTGKARASAVQAEILYQQCDAEPKHLAAKQLIKSIY